MKHVFQIHKQAKYSVYRRNLRVFEFHKPFSKHILALNYSEHTLRVSNIEARCCVSHAMASVVPSIPIHMLKVMMVIAILHSLDSDEDSNIYCKAATTLCRPDDRSISL